MDSFNPYLEPERRIKWPSRETREEFISPIVLLLGLWQLISLIGWFVGNTFCERYDFSDPCVTYIQFIVSQYHWVVETAGKLW